MLNLFQHLINSCKDLSMGFRNEFGMTDLCHAELVYAMRAFALRKLFNAALACLGHQHPTDGCKDLSMGFLNKFGMTV